ncbi:MAG TPA: diacylglycerol kinase family protein [Actinomycetes bacterium]|nr:diacylglycerol kinase family protein [Actinomycetes bacterium]
MRSVSVTRRVGAIVALAAAAAVVVVEVVALARNLLLLLVAVACLGLAIAAAAYAVTRTGARRSVAAVVAVLALVAPVVLVVAQGQLWLVLLLVGLVALAGAATRYALGRDLKSLKSGPTPGTAVGPAARPALLMNPRSGGGKVERFRLVEEARRRGIEPVVLAPGDDLLALAQEAVGRGADVIGMAGGDGSQALVAGVAMAHDVAFVCVPAGTRNHLAMDLGLDRDDVVGALDAFGPALERRIDLGLVGDRVFVNNATAGLYAKIVQSPEYRDRKVGTALELLPRMLGPDAAPFDLRFTGPDGTEYQTAHLILVSNDKYELGRGEGFGSRRRLDAGTLGIVAARFRSSGEIARFVQLQATGRARRFSGWGEWTDTSFELRSGQPVEVGIDGEAILLDPPVRFRVAPGALRVRIPPHAPGYSPAAAAPTPGWSTITALLQTAAGRPVTIEP